ncbi:carbohydrate-binding module family 48 protein [Hypoxylon sp. FL1150]|nr:carbohydrate-binding module family 48 protein [Hypoxylon sp. FL1150]
MGNNPSSTSKPATPTNASIPSHESPRASKKEPKNLVSLHNQHIRSPASPEASAVQATGTSILNKNSQSRPLSILNSSSPTTSSNNPAVPTKVSEPKQKPVEFKDEHSKPVAVPISCSHSEHDSSYAHSQYEESLISGPTSSSIQDMSSYHHSRPPRLPLPIEEEIHTPGSPIFPPADADEPVDDVPPLDDSGNIGPRRASGLSNATDEEDTEELRVDKTRPTIPTRIEWLRGGQKVYVTGTPFQWSRKQRLVPSKDREGVLESVIPVFPGTHHIKFLVDGSMQTSPDLPTTVDFGNNLVNYIEVSGENASSRNLPLDTGVPKSNEAALSLPSRQPSHDDAARVPQQKIIDPVENFTSKMPHYLEDFDQPEDTHIYRLSTLALERLPPPPSLPGFLSKPIMNNNTLIKDDNSVLNMPNHTVLNHLATCSIKNNILAVSATTRYQNKYVTTVVYKATRNE